MNRIYNAVLGLVTAGILAIFSLHGGEFTSLDIGAAIPGSTISVDNGFDIEGSGADIWGTADSFRFVYQSWSGDFDIRAKVLSIENTNTWAKAGVMIRQSTTSNSLHAMLVATPGNGIAFQYRTANGSSSSHVSAGAATYPNVWVRLIRVGTTISAYKATDSAGTIWEKVSAVASSNTDPVLVGLCVTSHNSSSLCTAQFRDVNLASYTLPVPGTGDGLKAQIFDNSDLTLPLMTRVDPIVNFNFAGGSPDPTVGPDTFSIAWSGQVEAQYSEPYTFYCRTDDGVRLWINNQLLIDKWDNQSGEWAGSISLSIGQKYDIRMEYYEASGNAISELRWSSPSTPKSIVPQSQLYSVSPTNPVVGTGTGLTAKYHNSIDLTNFDFSRLDSTINFEWGLGSPGVNVAPDRFSASWSGKLLAPSSETYTIYTLSDDGIRVFLDGKLIINNWTNHAPTENSTRVPLNGGQLYDFVVEYYEHTSGAVTKLQWSSATQPKQVIPTTQLYPIPPPNNIVVGTGTGLTGRYYNNSNLTDLKLTREDSNVDFIWGTGSPDSTVDPDLFSVIWTGRVEAQFTEEYIFYFRSDDGVRLWVDEHLLIDDWTNHGVIENTGRIKLQAGRCYEIRIEYYEYTGPSSAQLMWSSPSTLKQLIPSSQLYPNSTPQVASGTGTGIAGSYFNNKDFTNFALSRVDSTVNFTWGNGSPHASIQPDTFSAIWSGLIEAERSETYTFYTYSDDGVRLFVNGRLIVSNMTDHPPTENSGSIALEAGKKYDIYLQYFESGGGATAKLSWSSLSTTKQIVPQKQLYPPHGAPMDLGAGVAINIGTPAESATNPAWIEGSVGRASQAIFVSIDGAPHVEAIRQSPTRWFVDTATSIGLPIGVVLKQSVPTEISVLTSNGNLSATTTQSINWKVTNLTGSDASNSVLTIRKGDSLLLTASANHGPLLLDADGDGIYESTGEPGQLFPIKYDKTGFFVAEARVDGVQIGTLAINVMDIRLPDRIVCQVGYQRSVAVGIDPAALADISFVPADPDLLQTGWDAFRDLATNKANIHLTPLKRGSPVIQARINGPTGPLAGYRTVDEFTYDDSALRSAIIDVDDGSGASVITMRPYVPNINFSFTMFAHTATFSGGAGTVIVNSSDFDPVSGLPYFKQEYDSITNEVIGKYTVNIEVPSNESMYCYKVRVFQPNERQSQNSAMVASREDSNEGDAEQEIAGPKNINGNPCKAKVERLIFCNYEKGILRITGIADSDDGREFEVKSISNSYVHFTDTHTQFSGKNFICMPGLQKFEVEEGADGNGNDIWADIHIGDKIFSQRVFVIQLNGIDVDKEEKCIGETFTFSASANQEIKWSGGGVPETGTGSEFKTKWTNAGEYTVTATVEFEGHVCTKTKTVKVVQILAKPRALDELCIGETKTVTVSTIPAGRSVKVEYSDAAFSILGVPSGTAVEDGTVLQLRGEHCKTDVLKLYDAVIGKTCGITIPVHVKSFRATPLGEFPKVCVAPFDFQEILDLYKCSDDGALIVKIEWTPDDPDIFDMNVANGSDVSLDFVLKMRTYKCLHEGLIILTPKVGDRYEDLCKQEFPFSINSIHVEEFEKDTICVGEESRIRVEKCDNNAPHDVPVVIEYDESLVEMYDDFQLIRSGGAFLLDRSFKFLTAVGIGGGNASVKFYVPGEDDPNCIHTRGIKVSEVEFIQLRNRSGGSAIGSSTESGVLTVCKREIVSLRAQWKDNVVSPKGAYRIDPIGATNSTGLIGNNDVSFSFGSCGIFAVSVWCDDNGNFEIDGDEHPPIMAFVNVIGVESLTVSEFIDGESVTASNEEVEEPLLVCRSGTGSYSLSIKMETCGEDPNFPRNRWEFRNLDGQVLHTGVEKDSVSINFQASFESYEYEVVAGCDINRNNKLEDHEIAVTIPVNAVVVKEYKVTDVNDPSNTTTIRNNSRHDIGNFDSILLQRGYAGLKHATVRIDAEVVPNKAKARQKLSLYYANGYVSYIPHLTSIGSFGTGSITTTLVPKHFSQAYDRGPVTFGILVNCGKVNPDSKSLPNVIADFGVHAYSAPLFFDNNTDGKIDKNDAWVPSIICAGFGLPNQPKLGERVEVNIPTEYVESIFDGHEDLYLAFRVYDTRFQEYSYVQEFYEKQNIKVFSAKTGGTPLTLEQTKWTEIGNVPKKLFLELPADGVYTVNLHSEHKDRHPEIVLGDLLASQTFTYLSHGLGAPDSVSPHVDLINSHASVNLANGNLFFSESFSSYSSALPGPDAYISYNHLDGLKTSLGRGWRTNYDMQIFDRKVDRNRDGKIDITDRVGGDLLILVDETGRRIPFFFDKSKQKFVSYSKSGLIGATIDPNAANFDKEVIGDLELHYKLTRNDNMFVYFTNGTLDAFFDDSDAPEDFVFWTGLVDGWDFEQPRMELVHNLQKQTVKRDGDSDTWSDEAESSQILSRTNLSPNSTEFAYVLTKLSGGESRNWIFEYDDGDDNPNNDDQWDDPYLQPLHRRIIKMKLSGNFTHSSGFVEFELKYENDSSKIKEIKMPSVGGDKFEKKVKYAPDNSRIGSISAVISEPFGGNSTYTISPEQNAWMQMVDAEGNTTKRIIKESIRKLDTHEMGRFKAKYLYDSKGNVVETSDGKVSQIMTYSNFGVTDANLLATSSISGSGGTARYTYNNEGLMDTATDAAGHKTTYEYTNSFLDKIIDARGKSWKVRSKNNRGQPTNIAAPSYFSSNDSEVRRELKYTYTDKGLLESSSDLLGYTSSYEYDNHLRLTKITMPGGATIEAEYDPLSQIKRSKSIIGNEKVITRDAMGRATFITQTDIGAVSVSYTRNGAGFEIVSTRGSRQLSKVQEDKLGRVKEISSPISNATGVGKTSYIYEPNTGWLQETRSARGASHLYKRNDAGQMEQITLPEGGQIKYKYKSGTPWVESVTDANGNETILDIDVLGRSVDILNALGGSTQTTFDKIGNIETVTPSIGRGIIYDYDDDGLVKSTTDNLLNKHTFKIKNLGTPSIVATPYQNNNRTITQSLDSKGFIEKIESNEIGVIQRTNRPDGVVQTSTMDGRGSYSIILDSLNRMRNATLPTGGSTTTTINPFSGDLTGVKNILGLDTTIVRDPSTGDALSSSDTLGNGDTVVKRDLHGNITHSLDALNRPWIREYDLEDRVIRLVAPNGIETRWTYTPGGLIETVTVAGNTTLYTYNGLNQVATITDPTGRVTKSEYDSLGLIICTSQGSLHTKYEYFPDTRLLHFTKLPGGRTIEYGYDSHGSRTSVKDPEGYITRFRYDEFDRLTHIIYPDSIFDPQNETASQKVEQFWYFSKDGTHNPKDIQFHKDRQGRLAEFTYDTAGRLKSKIISDNNGSDFISYDYNAASQITRESFNGSSASRTYDARGRLETLVQDAQTVEFAYRPDNSIDEKRIIGGEVLKYAYNNVGQLETITQGADSASLTYDNKGRVDSISLPNNVFRQIGYDDAGRIETMSQLIPGDGESYSYDYDNEGRLKGISSTYWSVNFTYDGAGRLVTEGRTGEGAYLNKYTYDKNDNRETMTAWMQAGLVHRLITFDAPVLPVETIVESGQWQILDGRLKTEVQNDSKLRLNISNTNIGEYELLLSVDVATLQAGSDCLSGFTFGENANGRYLVGIFVVKNQSGLSERRLVTVYIDAAGEIYPIEMNDAVPYNGEVLKMGIFIAQDTVVVRIAEDGNTPGISCYLSHGSVGSLGLEVRTNDGTNVSSCFDNIKWTEISGGSRVSREYDYNSINQLLSMAEQNPVTGNSNISFTYNASGTQQSKTVTTSSGSLTTQFEYDRINRLTQANVPGSGVDSYSYYGASWMRASVLSATGITNNFLYDGHNCIREQSNGQFKHYVTPGNSPLWERTNGVATTYSQDGRGNLIGLIGAAGQTTKFTYDGFGNVSTLLPDGMGGWTGAANSSGPRFQGERYDASTNLIYLRNRMYDPQVGRFMSLDPKGMVDGPNMYNYCGGDPVNRVDPMGTDWVWNGADWIESKANGVKKPKFDGWYEGQEYKKRDYEKWKKVKLLGISQYDNYVADNINIEPISNEQLRKAASSLKDVSQAMEGASVAFVMDQPELMRPYVYASIIRDVQNDKIFDISDGKVRRAWVETALLVDTVRTGIWFARGLAAEFAATRLSRAGTTLAGNTQRIVSLEELNALGFRREASFRLKVAQESVVTSAPIGFESVEAYQKAWGRLVVPERLEQISSQMGRSAGFGETYAVAVVREAAGNAHVLVSHVSSSGVKGVGLIQGEELIGKGFYLKGVHAEDKILDFYIYPSQNVTPLTIGATRALCPTCVPAVRNAGFEIVTPVK